MRSKLTGHAMQLLGFALTFAGLGIAATAFVVAGNYPGVPLWAFVAGAMVLGVPLMVAGGRVNSRGRGRVLGQTPAQAAEEYRQGNVLLAIYLAILLAQGFWVAAPVFIWATGWAKPGDAFVSAWLVTWTLLLCAGRAWVTRPLFQAAARRVLAGKATSEASRTESH